MATSQSISIFRGGSYVLEVELLDEDGTPLDPTGLELHYKIGARRSYRTDPVLFLTEDDMTIAQDGTDWVASIPLTTARTELLDRAGYYHELYLIDADGERFVMMRGRVTVGPSRAAFHGEES